MSTRATVLFLVTLFTVGLIAITTAPPSGNRRPVSQNAAISSSTPSRAETERQPRIDLSGNDVNYAVATYKLDPTGSLYEEHSPQTEVPHLQPPKT